MPDTIFASPASCWDASTLRCTKRRRRRRSRGLAVSRSYTARPRASGAQLLFSLGHALAQFPQLGAAENLAPLGEHLLLFFVGVMLDQILEGLGLGGELLESHPILLHFRENELDHVVLFLGLEVHLQIFLRAGRITEGGIENLLLDHGVDL